MPQKMLEYRLYRAQIFKDIVVLRNFDEEAREHHTRQESYGLLCH